ncbi:MAG: NF038122 family metalloprotease [Polymorphobacter sp.]
MGHALGFISGVDTYDYYGGPGGPGRASNINLNNYATGTVLDLFRYSNDPSNLVVGTAPVLDWSVKTASYFSVDGGVTAYGGGYFSTGAYNGDGRQASHWKDAAAGATQLGLLDPTISYGQRGIITALDLAAFDAIGWNTSVNVIANAGYTYLSTANAVYSGNIANVPEPASWALLITGFGLVGGVLRRRRVAGA